jgi:transcription termination factor Rho
VSEENVNIDPKISETEASSPKTEEKEETKTVKKRATTTRKKSTKTTKEDSSEATEEKKETKPRGRKKAVAKSDENTVTEEDKPKTRARKTPATKEEAKEAEPKVETVKAQSTPSTSDNQTETKEASSETSTAKTEEATNTERNDSSREDRNSGKNDRKDRHHRNNKRNKKNFRNKEKSTPAKVKYLELIKDPESKLRQLASEHEIANASAMSFTELSFEVFKALVELEGNGLSVCQGILEILQDGYGFLRRQMCTIDQNDVYVSSAQIKRLGLKTGDFIVGQTRAPKDSESYQALLRVECINDLDPEKIRKITNFEKLVPLHPNQKFQLCGETSNKDDLSLRIIDLVTPIGKGQRGLIVAPPKAGKTTLLKQIANSLTSNHPDLTLFVLLIDERPEEVTDMTRSVEGEVFASTFDQHLTNHIRVSEMVLERAKRLVEQGKDVVILLDSITRLARAYNIAIPSSGQTLSGGVNPLALYKPKKFFGSARNIEFGGSLTILATALIDTGSKMDDVIFEEFKGTGNMELHLDRSLFNKRIFPAINLSKSSTRREELLVNPDIASKTNLLRKAFESVSTQEAIEHLKKMMKKTRSNDSFLDTLQLQRD